MKAFPQTHSPGSSQAGFTLIELLVALALFAIVLAMVPGALQLARRAWEDVAVSDRNAQVVGVRTFLEQRLAEVMPVFERNGEGRRGVAFAGGRNGLMFVSPAPDGPGGAGIYRFEIGVGAQARAIVMRQTLFAPGSTRGAAENHILLEDVSAFRFRYFGRLRSSEGPAWHENWPRVDALPELIELSAALRGRNAPSFQPLVVTPKLQLPQS